ncbi:MAG: helix-turn-helix domain-containing protein [Bacteriovoracales bacterium]|nr:helix-turn-helix domain-containing protein [Bacteriovoracales bacterium]
MVEQNEEQREVSWPEYLTTKEAARHLRITPNALRIMVHRQKIKSYKLGNRLRFKRSEIEDLLKEEN